MPKDILKFFGDRHAGYIHARGKEATEKIVELLECKAHERVLEVGFGTGATLVQLASVHTRTHFHGLEASPLMLKKALNRIRFCLLHNRIQVGLFEKKGPFPYEDDAFDKVYAESVLSIQEVETLKSLLLEIQRVLKPGGVLVFNETIWLNNTPVNVLKKINADAKLSFGIIQANETWPYLKDWKRLLKQLKFHVIEELSVDKMQVTKTPWVRSLHQSLSWTFTKIGRIRFTLNPSMRAEWRNYQVEMSRIVPVAQPVMGGVIVKAVNQK